VGLGREGLKRRSRGGVTGRKRPHVNLQSSKARPVKRSRGRHKATGQWEVAGNQSLRLENSFPGNGPVTGGKKKIAKKELDLKGRPGTFLCDKKK